MKPETRLLIVDDNTATRYALRRRLERQGFVVSEAGTGTEGLALLEERLPDALILDVNLPDMSGFDIVRQLRAAPRTALLPVVHVSAASIQTGDIVTGLEAGADAYLVHPVDPTCCWRHCARCCGCVTPSTPCATAKNAFARFSLTSRRRSRSWTAT